MINQESFNVDLYKLLKTRGYRPIPKDAKNQRTQPEEAEVFSFTFMKDQKDYGDVWVTIDDAQSVVLYYSNEQEESPSGKNTSLDYDDSWSGFKRHLKQWAMGKQLTFELRNKDELGDDMAQRDYVKKKKTTNEAYHPMGKKASYNDNVPAVKIILQHNRQIEEGEQRYRNIAKIFLENQDGERFLAPTTRPGIAQIYARHIAESGVPNDERWNHIKSICEEYSKMGSFVRAIKNKQFNESAQSLVNEGINHYQSLRETLGKLRGHRGYNQYFESWTPALMEDDTDGSQINELFVQETVDPRIASVMPILSRLHKKIGETQVKEVAELAEWADSITEMDDGVPDNLSPAERKEQKERDKKEYDKNLKKTPDAIKKKLNLPSKIDEGDCGVEEDLSSMMRTGAKKVQRAFSFWDGSAHLEDLKDYVKNASDETLIRLAKDAKDDPKLHSPRAVQVKLIDRELKRRFGLTPKGNIKSEETLEDLDADQKRVGQLGPTEKVGKAGAVGKLVGANESVDVEEGTPEHEVIWNVINGNLDAYDVMNHPKTPAQRNVAGMMQERYDEISSEYPLHADDDFEKILDKLVDELADDYGTSGYSMNEGHEAIEESTKEYASCKTCKGDGADKDGNVCEKCLGTGDDESDEIKEGQEDLDMIKRLMK